VVIAGVSLLLVRCGADQGDAVQLVFTSTPAMVVLEQPFSVEVQARDGSGHGTGTTQGGQRVEIQLGLGASPTGGSLGGPDTAIADGDGNAWFQGLTLDISGQYAFIASAPGVAAIPPVTSAPFSVIGGPAPPDAGP
jgi:hypothetical protein